jgi:hypothetical protein
VSTLTLLNIVNEVLKDVRLIQGETGELTSLTASNFQTDVDMVVHHTNRAVRYMYDQSPALPQEAATGTITLVDGTREYSLASDFNVLSSDVMIDQTNGHRMCPYPGGYVKMFEHQIQPSQYTGRPNYYVISPINGNVRLDTIPGSDEDGSVYTYTYQKTLNYDTATDTFPFSDEVVRELVPAISQMWRKERDKEFDPAAFSHAIAVSVEKLAGLPRRDSW